ncbi:hypothetical protein [Pontibacter actiniarum]|uniref:Outer membrane protein beta-barrel domain-containing protein n=1 Tax=Pontibacter actiniarum TaxID=323450 RepID=A0A1X9YWF6_9BACT|nr:hypothetical protein [Pontibacter actiniarum]ARS37235.1 hypothetical protein CA264_18365 [Pontibacter actiniarum]
MIRFLAFILAAALLGATPALAQQQEDESFQNELSYGVNFNSNGGLIGGAFIRSSFYMNERMYQFGGIEVVEVKHPKENRYYSLVSGDSFIYGKKNYFFVVRPHYGRELVLFRKAADSGVQVNAIGAIGPSLGLLVPYYIDYNYNGNGTDIRTVPYDEREHANLDYILGSDTVFRGFGETKIKPGVHAKAGLSFEYGRYRESIAGIEVGVSVEYFPSKPVIIPLADNNNTFTAVYLNLYYGSRK